MREWVLERKIQEKNERKKNILVGKKIREGERKREREREKDRAKKEK